MVKKKNCLKCMNGKTTNGHYDLCPNCWNELRESENSMTDEDRFLHNLESGEVHTVYIMYYGNNEKTKIGYTKDLTSRLLEIKKKYPDNKLAYFREFSKESSARRYECWLKSKNDREQTRIAGIFLGRIKRIDDTLR